MPEGGRYRLVRRIAQGGMAEVFEAVAEGEHGFERKVAVKRMLASDDDAQRRMFVDEARIASRLHHANVVAVLDYGLLDDQPFQVLELVDGMHAGELCARGERRGAPMSPAIALHLCAEVAHGLAHAHGQVDAGGAPLGIVHRDVSPSNVLVSWDGDVKLSDFGIAVARGRVEVTEDGVTKGKLSFMSPEQAKAGHLDGRSDLYSLGCTLVALLHGASPQQDAEALSAMLRGEPVPLPELPDDVRAIAAKALSPAPRDRYASASAMAEALGRAASRRLDTDPRSALRGWLAELRDDEPKRSPLDAALLDLALVLEPGTPDGVRTFHSERTSPNPSPSKPEPIPQPSLARRLTPLVALVLAAGAVTLTWRLTRDPEPIPVAQPQPDPDPEPDPEPDPDPNPDPEPDPDPDPDPSPDPVPAPDPQPTRARRRAPLAADPAPPPPARTASAVLLVGGAGALQSEILVDGRSSGYAPRRLELPVGRHQLVLVKPDGTRLGPHRVQLTERHTALSPARWIVP